MTGGGESSGWFRLMMNLGDVRSGTPLAEMVTNHPLRIEITPRQMIRLVREMDKYTLTALMMAIEGSALQEREFGRRLELDGWGTSWLIERGFSKGVAERVNRELTTEQFIVAVKRRGADGNFYYKGRQVGVIHSSISGFSSEVSVEELRTDGAPKKSQKSVEKLPRPSPAEQMAGASSPSNLELAPPSSPSNLELGERGSSAEGELAKSSSPERGGTGAFAQVTAVPAPAGEPAEGGTTKEVSSSLVSTYLTSNGSIVQEEVGKLFGTDQVVEALGDVTTLASVRRSFDTLNNQLVKKIFAIRGGDAVPSTWLTDALVGLMRQNANQTYPMVVGLLADADVAIRNVSAHAVVGGTWLTLIAAGNRKVPPTKFNSYIASLIQSRDGILGDAVSGRVLDLVTGRTVSTISPILMLAGLSETRVPVIQGAAASSAENAETALQKFAGCTPLTGDATVDALLRLAVEGTEFDDEASLQAIRRNQGWMDRLLARQAAELDGSSQRLEEQSVFGDPVDEWCGSVSRLGSLEAPPATA